MTAPTPDAAFLDKVLAQVQAVAKEPFFDHERGRWLTWDQGDWHVEGTYFPKLDLVVDRDDDRLFDVSEEQSVQHQCGTSFCFAGWAVEMDPDVKWLPDAGKFVDDNQGRVIDIDDHISHVESWAQHRLGLTTMQAQLLFDAANTLEDLQDYVTRIKDGDQLVNDLGLLTRDQLDRGSISLVESVEGVWEVTEDDGDTISICWHGPAPTEEEDVD